MSKWKKLLVWIGGTVLTVNLAGYAAFSYMNRIPPQLREPNYYSYYQQQDTTPEGRVGIFITHLVMPEEMQTVDFFTLAQKALQYIPWPINKLVAADRGVVLLDPDRYYEFEEFKPARLVDPLGSEVDLDGVPYVNKWAMGEVDWVPPREDLHLDHGFFLLDSRSGGMPSVSAKLINKARHYYYAAGKGSVQGKVPHQYGMGVIVAEAMEQIRARYGDVPYRWITAENFGRARTALRSLLDEGIDTVVLSAPAAIYSHHEEFNGGFKHAMHYIHEWEEANDKKIKVIMTRQLGDFAATLEPWNNMLRDRLDTLPAGADVKVVMSTHGMPWDRVPHEAWIELAPGYVNGALSSLRDTLESYPFDRTQIVQSQDHFADAHNNPDGKYLATNTAFWDGVNDGYDYVINVPIEFFAENTDTMYFHMMANFENFPGYELYETVDYPDWNVPFTRQLSYQGTTIIYNGVPVGNYNKPLIRAYVAAVDEILSQGSRPILTAAQPR